MTYDPKFTSSSQSSSSQSLFDAPDDTEKYVLATIPTEESNGLLPTVLLISLLLLIGLISLLWVSLGRPVIPLPTPTPTATRVVATTATVEPVIIIQTAVPNQRATEVVGLIQTRAASDLENDQPDLATIVAVLVSNGVIAPELVLTPAEVSTPTATPDEIAQAETETPLLNNDDIDSNGSESTTFVPIVDIPSEVINTPVDVSNSMTETVTVTPIITVTSTITTNIDLPVDEETQSNNSDINLPIIVGANDEPDLTVQPTENPIETIVPTVTITTSEIIPETPTPEFTETPTEIPTEIPIEIPTEMPTEEPLVEEETPTPTPEPAIFAVLKGKAVSDRGDITVYKGPSRIYETEGVLTAGKDVNISDRDLSGEWIYVCCSSNNTSGWVRQVEAPPVGNLLSDIIGDEAAAQITSTPETDRERADDVRWLTVRNAPTNPSLPTWPAIPTDHYVLQRYNPGNQANGPLPQLIKGETLPAEGVLIEAWSPKQRALGPILTSAATTGLGVYITSEDGSLYQRRIDNGEEQSNYSFGDPTNQVSVPIAVFDQTIYAASSNNELFAISEQRFEKIWSRQLVELGNNGPLTPITGINILGNKLYLGASNEATQYLVSLDRRNDAQGTITFTSPTIGRNMQLPAVGNQLVYVGNERITAFDAHDGSTIWQAAEPEQISAPPVYSTPGVVALAELYVAANQILFALDANTGQKIWSVSGGGITSGMALGDDTIYASAGSELKAFARVDGEQEWTRVLNSEILGGPFANGNRMIVVTRDGFVHYLNTADGSTLFTSEFLDDNARYAPAITSKYIFIPGENNKVFAWRGE